MIVAEPYQRDGRTLLRNIRHEPTLPPGHVELAAMPAGFVKLEWDGRRATPIVPTAEEKLDQRADLLTPAVLRALVVLLAPSSTDAQRAAAGVVLDAALGKIETARAQVALVQRTG